MNIAGDIYGPSVLCLLRCWNTHPDLCLLWQWTSHFCKHFGSFAQPSSYSELFQHHPHYIVSHGVKCFLEMYEAVIGLHKLSLSFPLKRKVGPNLCKLIANNCTFIWYGLTFAFQPMTNNVGWLLNCVEIILG